MSSRNACPAGTTARVTALITSAGIAGWQAVVATRAAHAAELARQEAVASSEFLEQVLMAASPIEAERDVRVREILALAESKVDERFRAFMQGQIEPILEPLRAAYEAERLQQLDA